MRNLALAVGILGWVACSDDGAIGKEAAELGSSGTGPTGTAASTESESASTGPTGVTSTEAGSNGVVAEATTQDTQDGSPNEGSAADGEDADAAAESGNVTAGDADESGATTAPASETSDGAAPIRLPPANAPFDYQLGGAYDPPAGVEIVSRDREDPPAAGLYNICYVNGYQTQPHEQDWWESEHPELLLRDENGEVVIDPSWDEFLLDIRTDASRAALAEIVGPWIERCAADGFDAVEIDNLDTYFRSGGLIEEDHAVAFMSLLSGIAHDVGLAIAQKNSTEILDRQREMGTDFAVAESCNVWNECQDYRDVYGDLVFVIEYEADAFTTGCTEFPELSIVLRDLELVTPRSGAYVYDGC